jgi:hypothetical protein
VAWDEFLKGLVGPYGVVILGAGLALAFYLRLIVPGTWWKTERAARIRAEHRVQQLLLIVGRVTGANEVFLEALRESQPSRDPSEAP